MFTEQIKTTTQKNKSWQTANKQKGGSVVAENKNEAAEATEETLEQNLDENATEEAKTQTEETEEKPENVAEESEGKEEPEESKDTKKEKKDKKDILIEELNDKYSVIKKIIFCYK